MKMFSTAVLFSASVLGTDGLSTGARDSCVPSDSDERFFQTILDDWATITGHVFHQPSHTVPWIILFSRSCAYHLDPEISVAVTKATRVLPGVHLSFAGRPVPLRAVAIRDSLNLPNGARIPVNGSAFTSAYGAGSRAGAFFVAALPEVWAHDPRYAADTGDRAEFVRSVVSHELVHTLQILPIRARLEALQARFPKLPANLDDDLIQRRFASALGMDATVRAEIELFYAAAIELDGNRARELAARALGLVHARRTVYFADSADAYGALEDVFLNMEGVACWGALQLALSRAEAVPPGAVLDSFRGNRKWWSQEEGLALFLVLDRLVPAWASRVMPPELASPIDLLETATKR